MNIDLDYIRVLVTVVLAVSGWMIGHYFNSKRNRDEKRRDIAIEHLINAYRIVTNEISHREVTPEKSIKFENLLSDIQLFGTSDQVILARNLADEVARGDEFHLDPLTNCLRDDLRSELRLSKINGNVKWLRLNNESNLFALVVRTVFTHQRRSLQLRLHIHSEPSNCRLRENTCLLPLGSSLRYR